MAKEITGYVKLQCKGGQANPAPPIGPALGSAGVNIMAFCKEFNAKTQAQAGDVLPVVIDVYSDKTFSFITKQPPVTGMIKKEAGVTSGSKVANRDKVGKLTLAQVEAIAKKKAVDMNAGSIEAAMQMVIGSARSMGIDVVK